VFIEHEGTFRFTLKFEVDRIVSAASSIMSLFLCLSGFTPLSTGSDATTLHNGVVMVCVGVYGLNHLPGLKASASANELEGLAHMHSF